MDDQSASDRKSDAKASSIVTAAAAGGLEGLPLNRRHPLHVLVHLGVPGADGDIAVMGSAQDPCAATGNYVNG
jgi:hypothetical protein